jgi:hypothetical protein
VKERDGVILAAKKTIRTDKDSLGRRESASLEEIMCITCEHELWDEHRALERELFRPCKTCNKFPGASSEGTCYHCYAIGNTIDECPECAGKPWSEEFLEAKAEIEGPDKLLLPF